MAERQIRMSVRKHDVNLTEPAQTDLQDILAYTLQTWGETQLAEYKQKISDAFGALSDNPQMGRRRYGLLAYNVGSHRIFYRVEDATIYILRILHVRMDAEQHLPGN